MRAGIDENVAVPIARVQLVERVILTPEDHGIHMRRAQQASVQPIGPAMVGTLNASSEIALRAGAQARAAVAADIIKSLNAAGIVSHYDDAFAGDLAEKVIAGVGNGIRAARADPIFEKELFHLVTEERVVGVVARRQCFGDGVHTNLASEYCNIGSNRFLDT